MFKASKGTCVCMLACVCVCVCMCMCVCGDTMSAGERDSATCPWPFTWCIEEH